MLNSTLEITTMIGCPLMCTFCPQDNLRDAYGTADEKYMSLETFKKVIDELPEHYRIDFSGMAEPWVNPDCTDMLAYCFEKGRRVAVYTTLYNWTREDVDRVLDLLVEYPHLVENFSVHMPDENNNMRGWKYSEDWEYAFRALMQVLQLTGIHHEAMTMSDRGVVHPALNHLGVKLWNWVGHDRAGSLPLDQVKEKPITLAPKHSTPITCSKTPRYDQNVVLPNGDVVLCCMDYDNKHVLGNLNTHTIDEIRQQPTFLALVEENARSCFSTNSLCRTCTDAVPQ